MSPEPVRPSVRHKIRKYFEKSQETFRHNVVIEKFKALYKEYGNDEDFVNEFKLALRYCLVCPDKTAAENVLLFVSKFVVALYTINMDQDDINFSDTINEECTFPNAVLEFLFENHGASSTQARLRCLQLLNRILSGMPDNTTISDYLWNKMKETVLLRIQDKSTNVRVQAVLTGRKLQDPKNSQCEIIKAFVFHLNDPNSAVRRAVVSSIAFNKFTVGHVLARTRDVNDNVRRNTYVIFSKIRVVNLTIKFRMTILERGLQDRSEMVKKCVQSVLLVNWLENFNRDVLKFLEALDVINCTDTVLMIVENILKVIPIDDVIKLLPFDEGTRTIPAGELTPEMALLWRCIAHYFWTEKDEEGLDRVLPNITVFCEYIRRSFPLDRSQSESCSKEEKWKDVKEQEILNNLLKLIKYFYFGDELGRTNLKKLIFDMIISQRTNNASAESLTELLASVVPSAESYVQEVTEIISEVREPLVVEAVARPAHKQLDMELKISNLKVILNELREREYEAAANKEYETAQTLKTEIEKTEAEVKTLSEELSSGCESQEVREEKNDPVTVCKCLAILRQMLRSSNVQRMSPTLRSIKENFLNQCLTSQDLQTQSLSIEVLGQLCVLDVELAKESLFRFILMLSENGEDEINSPALKSVFDILMYHGIKPFENLHNTEEEEKSRSEEDLFESEDGERDVCRDTKFIPILLELLNCKTNDVLKSIAFEGLCKLLLSGVIYSPSALQRVIIKGFSPIVDNESEDYIRQAFMAFFPAFASMTPRSQEMIESAFVPTLKKLIRTPLGEPEADINVKDVATFLAEYTKPNVAKDTSMTLHVHNNLAMALCHEILKEMDQWETEDGGTVHLYLKTLLCLNLTLDSDAFIDQMRVLTGKIKKGIDNRTLLRLVNEFSKKFENICLSSVSPVKNTLPTAVGSNESSTTGIALAAGSVAQSVNKEEDRMSVSSESPLGSPSTKTDNFVPESPDESDNKENNCIPESPDISD